MLVVWRKASSYNLASNVSTWIFGIAWRRALKALKRIDNPVEFDPDDCPAEQRRAGGIAARGGEAGDDCPRPRCAIARAARRPRALLFRRTLLRGDRRNHAMPRQHGEDADVPCPAKAAGPDGGHARRQDRGKRFPPTCGASTAIQNNRTKGSYTYRHLRISVIRTVKSIDRLNANGRADNLGLRDRRRGLGRLRAREPAFRRRPMLRTAARSRSRRSLPVDPHSDRVREDDVPPGLQLVLQDRARSGHERATDLLAARAHAWRIERDQRPHLHPRSARGLRWLGRAGNPGWSYDDVLPYFRKLEHNVRGANEWHGADGPLWASDIGAKHELIEALIAAGGEIGIPRNDDFNGATQEGIGYYQLTTRRGLRCSTAVAYLRPARSRRNLARGDRSSRDADSLRRPQGDGHRVSAARAGCHRHREPGSDTRRGRVAVATAPAALWRRRARAAPAVRDPRRPRAARRRREPAGPPAGARHLSLHEADHDQRHPALAVAQAGDGRAVRPLAQRPDGRRHQSGRHLRAHRSRAAPAGCPVPRRDAVLGHGRLARPRILRDSRCRCASCSRNRAAMSA